MREEPNASAARTLIEDWRRLVGDVMGVSTSDATDGTHYVRIVPTPAMELEEAVYAAGRIPRLTALAVLDALERGASDLRLRPLLGDSEIAARYAALRDQLVAHDIYVLRYGPLPDGETEETRDA